MRDYYFDGQWRMDWGFGNPNITGAFIATLMVAVWMPAFWGRRGFWFSLVCNSILGGCLVHTYSRGAFVGLIVGLLPIAIVLRPWKRHRVIVAAFVLLCLAGYAWNLGATKRYAKGIVTEDKSVSNRWTIYRVVPRMIWDAAEGWGLGRASEAYRQWYQPQGRRETYKHLVSSHATWLVELGWMGRTGYVAVWASVLVLSWPAKYFKALVVPLGVWLTFGVAAAFSDVAHEKWLWGIPVTMLLYTVGWRIGKRQWPKPLIGVCSVVGLPLVLAGATFWLSRLLTGEVAICLKHGVVSVGDRGSDSATYLPFYDKKVLGEFYGHCIRGATARTGSHHPLKRIEVQWGDENWRLTESTQLIVLAGEAASKWSCDDLQHDGQVPPLIFLNPSEPGSELRRSLDRLGPINVVFGDHYMEDSRLVWETLAASNQHIAISYESMSSEYIAGWADAISKIADANLRQ